jgi:hypothetical protein
MKLLLSLRILHGIASATSLAVAMKKSAAILDKAIRMIMGRICGPFLIC